MKRLKLTAYFLVMILSNGIFSVAAQTSVGSAKSQYELPTSSSRSQVEEYGPRSYPVAEGVWVAPYINLSLGRDSNLFLLQNNKKASNFRILNPGFVIEAHSPQSMYKLAYDGKFASYASSKRDNYEDHMVAGTGEFLFSQRSGLRIGLDFFSGHDARGSTDRGISIAPDKFDNSGFNALYAYGANGALGRFELEGGAYRKRYTNNRDFTFGSDRNSTSLGGRLFYRVMPKTYLLFELKQDRLDYTFEQSPFDSKETRYLVGATWEATAATTGTVKFGRIKKDLRLGRDSTSTGWDAQIQWMPFTYSKFNFNTSKSFSESTGLGDFILSKRYGVTWNHSWTQRFETTASLSRADDDYQGFSRNDSTNAIGFKVNYKFRRWLTVGGEVSHTNRDSNREFDYKRNLYLLTLGATL